MSERIDRKYLLLKQYEENFISGQQKPSNIIPFTRDSIYIKKMLGYYSGELPHPFTRTDYYYAFLAGLTDLPIPYPLTREDHFLARMCGKNDYPIPTPKNVIEKLLQSIMMTEIKEAEGKVIQIEATESRPLRSLSIYGRSSQVVTQGNQLLPYPYHDSTITTNGITVIDNGDGSITINGTATETIYFGFVRNVEGKRLRLNPGKYVMSINRNTGVGLSGMIHKKDGTTSLVSDGVPFESDYEFEFNTYIYVEKNKSLKNVTIYPMLNAGGTPLPFEPYTGGKPSPSPEYPQEISSAGDGGEIELSISGQSDSIRTIYAQSIILPTQDGFPGVPVTSGGNYKDENGKQWVCDTIEYVGNSAKYVQRVKKVENPVFEVNNNNYEVDGSYMFKYSLPLYPNGGHLYYGICSKLEYDTDILINNYSGFYVGYKNIWIRVKDVNDVAVANEAIAGATFLLVMPEPIETDLPVEVANQLKSLHTYSPNTIITNDADCHMKVSYAQKANEI